MRQKKYSLFTIISVAVIASSLAVLFCVFYLKNYFVQNNFGGTRIVEAYNTLKSYYYGDVDEGAAVDGAIKGMAESFGDPYTAFYNAEDLVKFNEIVTGEYSGIGVLIGANNDDSYITVVTAFKNSPAAKAGIDSGDKIIAVEGETFLIQQSDMAVAKMKRKKGEEVTITVMKKGTKETVDIHLICDDIIIPSVDGKLIEKDIAYIEFVSFEENSYSELTEQIQELKNQGATKIILDMRDNGGGILKTCLDIADYFLDSGKIIQVQYKNGKSETAEAQLGANTMPMVVLVNDGSASASEVLTAALQDNGRAKIVGTQTFGKGVIQGMYDLKSGGGIKITNAHYLTPNGADIDKVGITPDYVVEGYDEQVKKAIELLK